MVTVAIGLSGNYLLFARSMQQQQHGTYQSRAVVLTRSIAEDLRAGRIVALADATRCALPDPEACAAIHWLAQVQARWRPVVDRQLPRAVLDLNRIGAGEVRIRVQWQDTLSLRPSVYQQAVISP